MRVEHLWVGEYRVVRFEMARIRQRIARGFIWWVFWRSRRVTPAEKCEHGAYIIINKRGTIHILINIRGYTLKQTRVSTHLYSHAYVDQRHYYLHNKWRFYCQTEHHQQRRRRPMIAELGVAVAQRMHEGLFMNSVYIITTTFMALPRIIYIYSRVNNNTTRHAILDLHVSGPNEQHIYRCKQV